jgi:hypothetical protein
MAASDPKQTVILFALSSADCGEIVAARGLFGNRAAGRRGTFAITRDENFLGNAEVFFERISGRPARRVFLPGAFKGRGTQQDVLSLPAESLLKWRSS